MFNFFINASMIFAYDYYLFFLMHPLRYYFISIRHGFALYVSSLENPKPKAGDREGWRLFLD